MKGGKVIKQDRQAAVRLIEQLTLQKDDTGFKADIRTVCRILGISCFLSTKMWVFYEDFLKRSNIFLGEKLYLG